MKQTPTPTLDKILQGKQKIEAWTVDDVAKSFKEIQSSIQKMEIALAKSDRRSYPYANTDIQLMRSISKQLHAVSLQLNQVLKI
ncbi:hypothetical protein DOM22_01175 [Bdellovibrio sp. ZAP7]|nr:hypothetical protein DOM22_01175 [Bdellovibrio sp. ZAP7]